VGEASVAHSECDAVYSKLTAMSSSKDLENTFARRPTWAEIDLNNLAANFNRVRQRVSPVARVMAVIKANAYGHGAVACARRLANEGADSTRTLSRRFLAGPGGCLHPASLNAGGLSSRHD
jgi:hypothetical protein